MPDDTLQAWCQRNGIAPWYHDIWGNRHEVPDEGLRALLAELGTRDPDAPSLAQAEADDWHEAVPPVASALAGRPVQLLLRLPAPVQRVRWTLHEESGARQNGVLDPTSATPAGEATVDGVPRRGWQVTLALPTAPGYHRLLWEGEAGHTWQPLGETLLVVAPERCYRPPALQDEGRVWGPALQLYSLRSERNWGIGDFGDLGAVIETFAERGAGIVGLNPLHALFPHNPHHISPYSPSSRAQLNVLYLDVEALPDFRECDEAQAHVRSAAFQQRLAQLRAAGQVDHAGVSAAKFEVLQRLYAHFRQHHLRTASRRGEAFRAFQRERGESLRLHATFEALQARFHAEDPSVWGWPVWPEAWRDPRSAEVERFQAEQVERIEYYEYLQWQADVQLQALSRRCRERGLAVGLYLDLAVSVDRAGSDMWGHAELYAPGASAGAPPDEFNPNGQDWGLPPLKPRALLQDRLRFFVQTLRGCMRHAGALRIDHVMGLMRLYWIPPQRSPRDGAYVHYPLQALLAVVARESERNRCMVIGEDLGTVADEMRAALAQYELLSYRLLYFERADSGSFKPPHEYPREALVAISTHDLATLAGWWRGHDLQVRHQLGLYPNDGVYEEQLAGRAQERVRLLLALQHAGLLPEGVSADPAGVPPLTQALVEAIHAYAATTPSRVMVMQLEDALGVLDQANLPGTVDQHPNWRQKLPVAVEALGTDARVQSLSARLAELRPHAPLQAQSVRHAEAIVPRATYRLQFHKDFGFDAALKVLPYLKRLGISHVYSSPLMRARPGSLHGYDVVAHDEINPELGGREGLDRFVAALHEHGMRLLIDMVPNHMGIGPDNAWWTDVLEHGEASPYARYFDIDWHPADRTMDGKVLLPVLGAPFGQVLDDGQLRVEFEPGQGSFALRYWDHRFPLDPRSVAGVLERAAARCEGTAGLALQSLATAFGHLPLRDAGDPAKGVERSRDTPLLKQRLVELLAEAGDGRMAVETAIAAALAEINTPDALDVLHEVQAYRLAYWRVASDEINYRRFFDVNELAALRMEEPAVFEATQGLALDLAAAGLVDGLRIDHPDGLHDPAQYFERLQQGYARRAGLPPALPDVQGRPARPLYVVAEKIEAGHEDLPDTWALHGTTGYRFANLVNGVLVDTAARERFDRLWHRASGDDAEFERLAYEGKRGIMHTSLASELTVLATELLRIARAHRRTRDHSLNTLREALAEVAACMPVYRTYIVQSPSAQDRRFVDWAVGQARRRALAIDAGVFDFVRRTLLAEAEPGADEALLERVRRFAMRFQQFTSPVTAKGVEDTAFYRYHRLVAINEVGGEPGVFGVSVRGFHLASAERAARWPHTMIATSTHDNKRSEDVRCRLDVLSEMPGAWRLMLRRFSAAPQLQRARDATARFSNTDESGNTDPIPSPADEYLLLQTLLGTLPAEGLTEETLPAYRERIERYAIKAVREAKRHTSWTSPNTDYEDGVIGFVRSVLARVKPNPVLSDLQTHAQTLAWFGAINSLSMVLLKYTSPGVPDLYQGNELMDLSLVDPDNRRPVDYALRQRMLDEMETLASTPDWRSGLKDMAKQPQDGRLKLWLTWRLLQLRSRHEVLFRDGNYNALTASGEREQHIVAFSREFENTAVVVAAIRLPTRLLSLQPGWPSGAAVWGDTVIELPGVADGTVLVNWLTGERATVRGGQLRAADVFETLPVAALMAASSEGS